MALREAPSALGRLAIRPSQTAIRSIYGDGRRFSSSEQSSSDIRDLEPLSSLAEGQEVSPEALQKYDPVKRSQARSRQLPPSRYQFRSPRYYRGPLHPHQPPPPSDPSSRLFVPGPFYSPRLRETWSSTIASDLMTLTYAHIPPGTVKLQKAERLRTWDDSSPYHKGRPKRGPRGGDVLKLIEKDINWRNIPKIEEVTISTMVKGAIDDSAHLHVAGIMLQAITGVRPSVHRAKSSVAQFGIRANMPIALTSTIRGEDAWAFVDKCVNLVFPRIKDWPGVKGSSGDSAGNISWGISPEAAVLFPEVAVNYDMYPPRMITGFHVTCKTTARSDRHARLLLSALGVPFYGKYVD